MKLLDLTLPTPAENLACDEALLDACEGGEAEEILRFWEPRTYFVVVGYANRVWLEVNREACEAEKLPVLRRCSGGGTVLQGPGCLNYALILNIGEAGPLRSIGSANRFIMERNRAALDELMRCSGRSRQALTRPSPIADRRQPIEVRGYTDLAIGGLKVSGNAQRRKNRVLLFHGTFLLEFDLSLMERILPLPTRQPEYRQNRPHQEFLANVGLTADSAKRALQQAWGAFEPFEHLPREKIRSLVRDKYANREWNLRFR
jgi:lipoate-protein ligase A